MQAEGVGSNGMHFIEGSDRHQTHLLPAAGFTQPKADPLERGRPSYACADLLKLYLYGYLHQLRSSRRLEAECHRNLEVLRLLGELKPDFKTIADFRKNNAPAFKAVVREFTRLCRQLDLFGGQLLAIDGTQFKAGNAGDRNWNQAQTRLEEYLQALTQAGAAQDPDRTLPGHSQVAPARGIFSARPGESGVRSESGAFWIQFETGAGGGGVGKTAGRAGGARSMEPEERAGRFWSGWTARSTRPPPTPDPPHRFSHRL